MICKNVASRKNKRTRLFCSRGGLHNSRFHSDFSLKTLDACHTGSPLAHERTFPNLASSPLAAGDGNSLRNSGKVLFSIIAIYGAAPRNSSASLAGSFPPMPRFGNLKGTKLSCVFKPFLDEKSLVEPSCRIVWCYPFLLKIFYHPAVQKSSAGHQNVPVLLEIFKARVERRHQNQRMMPIMSWMMTEMAPTVMVTLPPLMMRLNTSRPRSSVPQR